MGSFFMFVAGILFAGVVRDVFVGDVDAATLIMFAGLIANVLLGWGVQ